MDSIVVLFVLLLFSPGNYCQPTPLIAIWSSSIAPRSYPNISAYFGDGQNTSDIITALPHCLTSSNKNVYPVDLYRAHPSFQLITRRLAEERSTGLFRYWNVTAIPTLTPAFAGVYRCRRSEHTETVSRGVYSVNIVRKPAFKCPPSFVVVYGEESSTPLILELSGTLPVTITRYPRIGDFEVSSTIELISDGVRTWMATLVVNSREGLGTKFNVTFNATYKEFTCSRDDSYPNGMYKRCASIPIYDTCITTITMNYTSCPATTVQGLNMPLLQSELSTVVSNFWCTHNTVMANNIKSIVCQQNGSWSELPKCVCPSGRKCTLSSRSGWNVAGLAMGMIVLVVMAALLVRIIRVHLALREETSQAPLVGDPHSRIVSYGS